MAYTKSSSSTVTPVTKRWSLIRAILEQKDATDSPFSIFKYISLCLSVLFWLGAYFSYRFTKVSIQSLEVINKVIAGIIMSLTESKMIRLEFSWLLLKAILPTLFMGSSTTVVTYCSRSCSWNIFVIQSFHTLKLVSSSSLSSALTEMEDAMDLRQET